MTFATTRWSMVVAAAGEGPPRERALAELCETYWYPLYAYARARGLDREDAADRTQAFFAGILERPFVDRADPSRGRFRAYLITAFRRHLSREREREHAARRGGGRRVLSLDFEEGERRFQEQPSTARSPEQEYERRFALTLLADAIERLRDEYVDGHRGAWFDALRPSLLGGGDALAAVAGELGMSVGAVRVALHRLRARYRDLLRASVADVVGAAGDVDDELRALLSAIAS